MVADGILQDPLEEERQLLGWAVAVALGETQHRILDDVERGLFVADREARLLEGAPLGGGEKLGKLGAGGQTRSSGWAKAVRAASAATGAAGCSSRFAGSGGRVPHLPSGREC
jgi:hypothetical protein